MEREILLCYSSEGQKIQRYKKKQYDYIKVPGIAFPMDEDGNCYMNRVRYPKAQIEKCLSTFEGAPVILEHPESETLTSEEMMEKYPFMRCCDVEMSSYIKDGVEYDCVKYNVEINETLAKNHPEGEIILEDVLMERKRPMSLGVDALTKKELGQKSDKVVIDLIVDHNAYCKYSEAALGVDENNGLLLNHKKTVIKKEKSMSEETKNDENPSAGAFDVEAFKADMEERIKDVVQEALVNSKREKLESEAAAELEKLRKQRDEALDALVFERGEQRSNKLKALVEAGKLPEKFMEATTDEVSDSLLYAMHDELKEGEFVSLNNSKAHKMPEGDESEDDEEAKENERWSHLMASMKRKKENE